MFAVLRILQQLTILTDNEPQLCPVLPVVDLYLQLCLACTCRLVYAATMTGYTESTFVNVLKIRIM